MHCSILRTHGVEQRRSAICRRGCTDAIGRLRLAAVRAMLGAIALLAAVCQPGMPLLHAADTTEANAMLHAALNTIAADQLQRHVDVLSDDTYEGRETGSRGGRAAGGYLGAELRKLGLAGGAARNSYYQTFNGGSRNILALLEGSDEKLKEDIIVIGAHYDHVGYGNSSNSYGPTGYIHNGADDNASGTAALLELMEAISSLPQRPKRTLLFALWDAEEQGLIGSKYWINHPTVPISRVRLMINADMLGRLTGNKLEVYGTRSGFGLRSLLSRVNQETAADLLMDFSWEIKANSDHHTFYSAGIPIIMLHTGLHKDYHRPSDDAEKINSAGLAQVTRLMTGLVLELANTPEQLTAFREASRRESQADRLRRERPLPPPPARLGISWNEHDGQAGLEVSRVTAGSPAAKAGLQEGDRLLQLAGETIDAQTNLRTLVLSAASQTTAVVRREGQAEPLTIPITLVGQPVKLGIAWHSDDAEPGSVLVVRVAAGLPAAEAGLRALDRIYAVDGHSFTSGEEFRQLITAIPPPVNLLVENRGRLRTVVLEASEQVAAH